MIAVYLIELLSDSSEKNRPSIFRFVTELLLFEPGKKKKKLLNLMILTVLIYFLKRDEEYLTKSMTVNQMCPQLYSLTLIHQTDITRKHLFKNITEEEEKNGRRKNGRRKNGKKKKWKKKKMLDTYLLHLNLDYVCLILPILSSLNFKCI